MTRNVLFADIKAADALIVSAPVTASANNGEAIVVSEPVVARCDDHVEVTHYPDEDGEWVEYVRRDR